jgi:hypothetical protein
MKESIQQKASRVNHVRPDIVCLLIPVESNSEKRVITRLRILTPVLLAKVHGPLPYQI